MRVTGESAMAGHAIVLLRALASHRQVRGSRGTHATPNGAQREERGEGGGVADAGEIDLGWRVTQRRTRRILWRGKNSKVIQCVKADRTFLLQMEVLWRKPQPYFSKT